MGFLAGTVDEDEAGGTQAGHGVTDFFDNNLPPRIQAVTGLGLHGCRSIKEQDDRVNRAAAPTDQAGNNRPCGGKGERGDGERPAG